MVHQQDSFGDSIDRGFDDHAGITRAQELQQDEVVRHQKNGNGYRSLHSSSSERKANGIGAIDKHLTDLEESVGLHTDNDMLTQWAQLHNAWEASFVPTVGDIWDVTKDMMASFAGAFSPEIVEFASFIWEALFSDDYEVQTVMEYDEDGKKIGTRDLDLDEMFMVGAIDSTVDLREKLGGQEVEDPNTGHIYRSGDKYEFVENMKQYAPQIAEQIDDKFGKELPLEIKQELARRLGAKIGEELSRNIDKMDGLSGELVGVSLREEGGGRTEPYKIRLADSNSDDLGHLVNSVLRGGGEKPLYEVKLPSELGRGAGPERDNSPEMEGNSPSGPEAPTPPKPSPEESAEYVANIRKRGEEISAAEYVSAGVASAVANKHIDEAGYDVVKEAEEAKNRQPIKDGAEAGSIEDAMNQPAANKPTTGEVIERMKESLSQANEKDDKSIPEGDISQDQINDDLAGKEPDWKKEEGKVAMLFDAAGITPEEFMSIFEDAKSVDIDGAKITVTSEDDDGNIQENSLSEFLKEQYEKDPRALLESMREMYLAVIEKDAMAKEDVIEAIENSEDRDPESLAKLSDALDVPPTSEKPNVEKDEIVESKDDKASELDNVTNDAAIANEILDKSTEEIELTEQVSTGKEDLDKEAIDKNSGEVGKADAVGEITDSALETTKESGSELDGNLSDTQEQDQKAGGELDNSSQDTDSKEVTSLESGQQDISSENDITNEISDSSSSSSSGDETTSSGETSGETTEDEGKTLENIENRHDGVVIPVVEENAQVDIGEELSYESSSDEEGKDTEKSTDSKDDNSERDVASEASDDLSAEVAERHARNKIDPSSETIGKDDDTQRSIADGDSTELSEENRTTDSIEDKSPIAEISDDNQSDVESPNVISEVDTTPEVAATTDVDNISENQELESASLEDTESTITDAEKNSSNEIVDEERIQSPDSISNLDVSEDKGAREENVVTSDELKPEIEADSSISELESTADVENALKESSADTQNIEGQEADAKEVDSQSADSQEIDTKGTDTQVQESDVIESKDLDQQKDEEQVVDQDTDKLLTQDGEQQKAGGQDNNVPEVEDQGTGSELVQGSPSLDESTELSAEDGQLTTPEKESQDVTLSNDEVSQGDISKDGDSQEFSSQELSPQEKSSQEGDVVESSDMETQDLQQDNAPQNLESDELEAVSKGGQEVELQSGAVVGAENLDGQSELSSADTSAEAIEENPKEESSVDQVNQVDTADLDDKSVQKIDESQVTEPTVEDLQINDTLGEELLAEEVAALDSKDIESQSVESQESNSHSQAEDIESSLEASTDIPAIEEKAESSLDVNEEIQEQSAGNSEIDAIIAPVIGGESQDNLEEVSSEDTALHANNDVQPSAVGKESSQEDLGDADVIAEEMARDNVTEKVINSQKENDLLASSDAEIDNISLILDPMAPQDRFEVIEDAIQGEDGRLHADNLNHGTIDNVETIANTILREGDPDTAYINDPDAKLNGSSASREEIDEYMDNNKAEQNNSIEEILEKYNPDLANQLAELRNIIDKSLDDVSPDSPGNDRSNGHGGRGK